MIIMMIILTMLIILIVIVIMIRTIVDAPRSSQGRRDVGEVVHVKEPDAVSSRTYIYIYIYMYIHICMYVYIERERYTYIRIYIYITTNGPKMNRLNWPNSNNLKTTSSQCQAKQAEHAA